MAAILGVSANYHDAAAALVVDGVLVAAQQEERLSRVKNDPSLPIAAARACLALGGVEQPDEVVFYEDPYAKLERVLLSAFRAFPKAWKQFPRAMASQLGRKVWVLDDLARALRVDRAKVTHAEHHLSHAASAFYMSGYERAAVLTVDAVGEDASTGIWLGEGTALKQLDSIAFPHSLGLFYAAMTAYLGFEVNEGEYKVMGLAAFGKPSVDLSKLITLHADGTFALSLDYFNEHTDTELGYGPKLTKLLKGAEQADVAASAQKITEEALLGLARRAKEKTGADALCLAGGVALNAVANARLFNEAGFKHVFAQPAAGDAGGAIGAALLREPRSQRMAHAALGVAIDPAEAYAHAQALGHQVERVSDPAEAAARALAAGEIIAWATGRCEFGPRALGQRSILSLPHPADVRERINRVIKRREPFRPFAPSALHADAEASFSPWAPDLARFMITVTTVTGANLEAVTHVDNTARLQIADEAPGFARLLPAVRRHTGRALVLNTSLNGKAEPIVGRAPDALAFWTAHSVDRMFVDDVMLTRPR